MSVEIEILNGNASWPLAKPLYDAVWPPHVLATRPWADVVFAHADLRVLVLDEVGEARCHVGIYRREITWNGREMPIRGIGGVMTHEHDRRRGYASIALEAAIQTLRDEGSAAFALLFCEPHSAPFYLARGWKRLEGEIHAEQPEGRVRFTAIDPYVHDLRGRPPKDGVIDLRGLPW